MWGAQAHAAGAAVKAKVMDKAPVRAVQTAASLARCMSLPVSLARDLSRPAPPRQQFPDPRPPQAGRFSKTSSSEAVGAHAGILPTTLPVPESTGAVVQRLTPSLLKFFLFYSIHTA